MPIARASMLATSGPLLHVEQWRKRPDVDGRGAVVASTPEVWGWRAEEHATRVRASE